MATGLTLKQYHHLRFYTVCEHLRTLRGNLTTEEAKHAFVVLSIEAQGLKRFVPRSLWGLSNN